MMNRRAWDNRTSAPDTDNDTTSRPVLELIKSLQNDTLTGQSLARQERRLVVEHLTGEGYSVVEIAAILKMAERTVARTRKAIREANSVEADPKFTAEMVGHLVLQADITMARIRRAIRGSSVSIAVKVDGERSCWTIVRELVQALQRLGCLPSAPHEIRGDLTHHIDQTPSFPEIEVELARLVKISETCPVQGSEVTKRIAHVKESVARLELGEQI